MALTKLLCGQCGRPLVKGEGLVTRGIGLRCYACEVRRSVHNAQERARSIRVDAWYWYFRRFGRRSG
jgi:uncharacterized Zn finger protein (UPF0148 family)